jgi:hypothetical protein
MTSFLGMNHAKRHSVNCEISDNANVYRCGCHERKTEHTENRDDHFYPWVRDCEFCYDPERYVWEVVEWVSQIGVSHQEHFEGRPAHLVFERDVTGSLETYREKDRDDLVSSLRLLKFK